MADLVRCSVCNGYAPKASMIAGGEAPTRYECATHSMTGEVEL